MFKLQSPSKYSLFNETHLLRCFFHCSKQFICSSILMLFSASAVLCFTPSISKNVSLWGLLSSREANIKLLRGEIWWIGRVGHGGHGIFGQKQLTTQCNVGNCTYKSLIMKGQTHWKGLKKIFTEAECSLSQQHQLAHWSRWVLGTLM